MLRSTIHLPPIEEGEFLLYFVKDGEVFHQIYKGSKSRQEMYQMIADTLTILTTGGEYHA